MFSESTALYDLIYSEFKDYPEEGEKVAKLLARECPGARRILDVGCGTGRHAALLTDLHGLEVDGLDIESGFLDIARTRCPDGRFFQGDMADFDLGWRYDAVICLFSSIGYVRTPERLASALGSMRRHVSPGGKVVVEPWFTPQAFQGGSVHLNTVDQEGFKISRMSRSEVRGRVSWIEFHYLVGRPDGIRHLREVHELGLFTQAEMMEAFHSAGFEKVGFDPEGLIGRGLYLATAPNEG